MFRLTKKKGRRHKSADSLLVTAPAAAEQKKKETFSLALADLQHKDALVEVFLNDGSHHPVLLSASITAGEVIESVAAHLPEDNEEEYQLYVQFKFGYGRMLEDHTVLSELGDDWGPLIRLALWTQDRRPFRTKSSQDLLSLSTQSLDLRHTSTPNKGSSDLCNSQDHGRRQRHYTLGFESLSHQELPRVQLDVPHPKPSRVTPLPDHSNASPLTQSTSTSNLTHSTAFRASPLRSQGRAGGEKGEPLTLLAEVNRRISQKRKAMTRQGSVPDDVRNAVATDTKVIVFEDGWSCTQSMPTTPTHAHKLANGSAFPFPQDSQTSLASTDALSSTHLTDILPASGISIDCSSISPSGSESNLDRPYMTRPPSRDKQEVSPDYFDRLEAINCTDNTSLETMNRYRSCTDNDSDTCTRDSSEDYFDRLEPTLKEYFDHLEAPVVEITRHNWDKASFLKQRARCQTQGAPPPKPFRGPTPAPIAEAIEKWNTKLRRSRVMRVTATPERQNGSTKNSCKPKSGGKSSLPSGIKSIFRMSSQDKGSKTQPKTSAPQRHIARHSDSSTSLADLCASLPSSTGSQRRSSSLNNLKVFRVQPQLATSPPSVPRPLALDRISQTSVDSTLYQHLFPDGKVQRLRKRTSEMSEFLDEEHLRLTAEEVQALYAATLGPRLGKERTSHLLAPPALPPRSHSLYKPSPEDEELRETLLTVLLEPTIDDPHTFPPFAPQRECGGPADCPLVAVAQSN